MTEKPRPGAVRRTARAAVLPLGLLLPLVAPLVAPPALAVQPEKWPPTPPVSPLQVLLVLVGLPLGLFALITLAVYVPSMARGERYTPGRAWRNENQWFGGPRAGLEATDDQAAGPPVEAAGNEGTGGASARW